MALRKEKFTMIAGSFYIPKNNPSKPGGEDAHFYSEQKQVIGVFDGVGGWAKKGVDAGIYARELKEKALDEVFDDGSPYSIVDPMRVLEIAFFDADSEGSSTACIITLVGDVLRAVNLGDSGFVVIRNGKTMLKSPVQQHKFNHPYQMGRSREAESPDDAEEMEVKVDAGDVVVAGTDGLFDNLFLEEIEEVVRGWLAEISSPEVLACALALRAWQKSMQKTDPTPFQMAAREAGVRHFGGKYDDITVVAAYLVPDYRNK